MKRLLTMDRTILTAFILLVMVVLGFTVFYLLDKDGGSTPSALDNEVQRMEDVLESNPSNPNTWIALGSLSLQQRDYDKAITEYEQALSLDEDLPEAYLGLGLAYMKKGDAYPAIDYLRQVLAFSDLPEFAHSDLALDTVHYYLGKIWFEEGMVNEALQELNESLLYNRTNADAIFLMGQVYEVQGNETAAEANYHLALSLVPNYADVYIHLGELYQRRGDGDGAVYCQAMANLFTGAVAEAVEQLESIVNSITDNKANAYWGLGWGYEKMNMRNEAVEAYRQVLSIDPAHRLAKGALQRLGAGT